MAHGSYNPLRPAAAKAARIMRSTEPKKQASWMPKKPGKLRPKHPKSGYGRNARTRDAIRGVLAGLWPKDVEGAARKLIRK